MAAVQHVIITASHARYSAITVFNVRLIENHSFLFVLAERDSLILMETHNVLPVILNVQPVTDRAHNAFNAEETE